MYYVCNQDIHKPFMIKEIKRKSREKRVIRVINCCKWVPFTLAKIKNRS